MNIKDLDALCIQAILSFLSDYDVCIFDEAFPEHRKTVNHFWTRRPEVNVDDVLLRDVTKLLEVLRRRKKLKIVTFKRCRHKNSFSELVAVIAGNCSDLETLDIPGLTLSEDDIRLISSCTTLKYINIAYHPNFKTTELVKQLVANNPHLEGVRFEAISSVTYECECCVSNKLFDNLPATIKQVEIVKQNIGLKMCNTFWSHLQNWRLEKLELSAILTEEHILKLSTQTSLKHLNISFELVGNSLETLFSNNPELEEVSLRSINYRDSTCLKYLPPTLKCLKLATRWNLDGNDDFVECVKTWKLESLSLYDRSNINFIIRVLDAAPSLYELHFVLLRNPRVQNVINVEKFAQLKILSLTVSLEINNNVLKSILRSCVNLQKLNLYTTRFNREIYSEIATLPKLEECGTYNYLNTSKDYFSCMQDLFRNKCLSIVAFHCPVISKANILTLIRDCGTFKKLSLHLKKNVTISKSFQKNIVQELKNRREIITLEILSRLKNDENFQIENLHSMLNLEIIDHVDDIKQIVQLLQF